VQNRPLLQRPIDATLTVTKAALVLGVHPNTVRTWSDAGRLRYYRINPRGDRRYRMGDLQRFILATAEGPAEQPSHHRRFGRGSHRTTGVDARARPPIVVRSGAGPLAGPQGGGLSRTGTIRVITALGDVAASAVRQVLLDASGPIAGATEAIRSETGFTQVSAWRLAGGRLTPAAVSGPAGRGLVELPRSFGVLGMALDATEHAVDPDPGSVLAVSSQLGREAAVAIPGDAGPWGVLLTVRSSSAPFDQGELEDLAALGPAFGSVVRATAAASEIAHQLHRAEALRRVAGDIGSRLDLDRVLDGLVEHATVLFEGDRAAVLLVAPDGHRRAAAAHGLSPGFLATMAAPDARGLATASAAARRPLFAVGYAGDPRIGGDRAAVIQEGFDTACIAPLLDGDEPTPLGFLGVFHDEPHRWTESELETMAALATQAGVAIRTAHNYAQLATWAAQLQSIQQLGARLNRLTSVLEIAHAIATELQQLIAYHNVRVYRLDGDELVPIAMHGQVGEYVDETPDQLRVKVGWGVTGWVATNRTAVLLDDAAADPRANTIPGTQEDLDESMLLAPMLFEDQVLGVLVLSKLGLRQFRPDDLRLLVIYASFAAQAMANADATGRLREQSAALERQIRSQRELLQLTESILTSLDVHAILEGIADRLAALVDWDNLAIEVVDQATAILKPVVARGRDADDYLQPWVPGEKGLATWVVDHNEPVLLVDQFDDPRVALFRGQSVHGSLVLVPLRDRVRATGVLTLERLGTERPFTDDEFELVKLFAAQVSIALQNAAAHGDVERRAQTDDLTGLLNDGTFRERLAALIANERPFSLVMLDLDDFRRINNRHGHQVGDRLLSDVAHAIVRASRDTDAVFRYGGDEFVVLLPGTATSDAEMVARRILETIEGATGESTAWRSFGGPQRASAGTATYPDDGATAEEVLLAADRASFVAKRSGGARVATAAEGLDLAGELTLQRPTPIDARLPAE